MTTFLVRKNCEYSVLIEAKTKEEATEAADVIPLEGWERVWSETEAEEEKTNAVLQQRH